MKKFFSIVALVLCAATSLFLVSCDNSDDPDVPVESPSYPWVSITYNYSEDFLNYFDVTYTVTDWAGGTQTLNITETGKKEVVFAGTTTTCNATIKIDVKAKSTLVPNDKKATLTAVSQVTYGTTKDGKQYLNGSSSWPFTLGGSQSNLTINDEIIALLKKSYEVSKTWNFKFKDGSFQE